MYFMDRVEKSVEMDVISFNERGEEKLCLKKECYIKRWKKIRFPASCAATIASSPTENLASVTLGRIEEVSSILMPMENSFPETSTP